MYLYCFSICLPNYDIKLGAMKKENVTKANAEIVFITDPFFSGTFGLLLSMKSLREYI